jgi:hypothetical protein
MYALDESEELTERDNLENLDITYTHVSCLCKYLINLPTKQFGICSIMCRFDLDDIRSRGGLLTGKRQIISSHSVKNGSGAHPTSYKMGTGAVSPEEKRQGVKMTLTSTSVEVKNGFATSPLPHMSTWHIA